MIEQGQFLLHTAPDGAVQMDVFFKEMTAWRTQKALAGVLESPANGNSETFACPPNRNPRWYSASPKVIAKTIAAGL